MPLRRGEQPLLPAGAGPAAVTRRDITSRRMCCGAIEHEGFAGHQPSARDVRPSGTVQGAAPCMIASTMRVELKLVQVSAEWLVSWHGTRSAWRANWDNLEAGRGANACTVDEACCGRAALAVSL